MGEGAGIRVHEQYIPALGYSRLTRFYDFVIRSALREDSIRRCFLSQARIRSGDRVVDIGCGTGTLAVLAKQAHPDAEVLGLDRDPEMLGVARRKAAQAGTEVRFQQGLAYELPYPDSFFDRVLSSFVFHHLTRENKVRTLREAHRVLRPGGELHVADWGRAANALSRAAFLVIQLLDGFATTGDNVKGALPAFIRLAGFDPVVEPARFTTIAGTLSFYEARKP